MEGEWKGGGRGRDRPVCYRSIALLPEAALRAQVQPLTPVEALAQVFQVAPILIKQRMADLNLPWPRTLAQQLRPETTWDD